MLVSHMEARTEVVPMGGARMDMEKDNAPLSVPMPAEAGFLTDFHTKENIKDLLRLWALNYGSLGSASHRRFTILFLTFVSKSLTFLSDILPWRVH